MQARAIFLYENPRLKGRICPKTQPGRLGLLATICSGTAAPAIALGMSAGFQPPPDIFSAKTHSCHHAPVIFARTSLQLQSLVQHPFRLGCCLGSAWLETLRRINALDANIAPFTMDTGEDPQGIAIRDVRDHAGVTAGQCRH